MKNFKILLLHELQSQLKSFTFIVMIPVALVVSLLVTNLQVTSYKDRMQVYLEQQKQSNERLEQIYVYSQFAVDAYMPPAALSVFAKGLDESIGNKITVSVMEPPELSNTSQRGNAFIKIFNNIDISGVVKILSIFMVLMAACPVAMDRERLTGKQTFANPVSRLEYYLSKYAALMAVACIMTAVIFITPVAWMTFDAQVELTLSAMGSVLLMMMFSILYLSVFVLVSLSVSVLSPKVSVATVSSLMVWAMLVFVYPFTVNSMIDRLVKIPSETAISEQIAQIEKEYVQELRQKQIPRCRTWSISTNYGLVTYVCVASKECFELIKTHNDYILPKLQNVNEQIYVLKENQKRKQLHKRHLYERFAFFVPDNIYQNVCEQIANTDYDYRGRQFIDAARNYRNVLIDYIRSKNGFGYAFFAQMNEADMRDAYEDYSQEDREKYCNRQNFNKIFTAETPRFTFFYRTKTPATWMVLLVLLNLALGGLSIQICNKYLKFN